MNDSSKDTVYIEVEEDITSIIDKVTSAKLKIVAVVLPKRASALQSIVNMRLLKKSAENAGKKIVLITNETGILPLAGAAGVLIAKNLQSKPEIPNGPNDSSPEIPKKPPASELAAGGIPVTSSEEPIVDKFESVGKLSGLPSEVEADEDGTEESPIEIGDDQEEPEDNKSDKAEKGDKTDGGSDKPKLKGLKVPNFERFRLVFFGGGLLLVALIFGIYYALSVMPKAVITVTTDSTPITTTFQASASDKNTSLDTEKLLIPAEQKKLAQAFTELATSTGQQDKGTKATGTLTIKNCSDTSPSPSSVSAGDRFTASSGDNSGKVFVSAEIKNIAAATLSGGSPVCGNTTINVVAESAGPAYNNASSVAYTSAKIGYPITGSAMAGGTSRVATIVAQVDIDGAKQKIAAKVTDAVTKYKQTLSNGDVYLLSDTANTDNSNVTQTSNVGDEAANVTVTENMVFTVITVKKTDFNSLILSQLKKQIDTTKLQISDTDLITGAVIKEIATSGASTTVVVTKDSSATSIIDQASLKTQLAGKKKGEVQSILTARPGIQSADVKLSPFWVDTVPKKAAKVTFVLQHTTKKTNGGN